MLTEVSMAEQIYRTFQNDAFDAVAFSLFGEEDLCSKIMAANPEMMDTLLFEAGEELNIPDLVVAPKKAANLPPWYSAAVSEE